MGASGRRKMRCEVGRCCCRSDHKVRCHPREAGKAIVRKEIAEAEAERDS